MNDEENLSMMQELVVRCAFELLGAAAAGPIPVEMASRR
jgi:hypothetical protein